MELVDHRPLVFDCFEFHSPSAITRRPVLISNTVRRKYAEASLSEVCVLDTETCGSAF